ncbi:unnamed protein product [Candida verbasci]|uniref:WD40 repeat-like protein n=1 Tax=Candida verbasci TaxID=1227364 RepID=A0A9W4TS44_9ASCO|nr:unnamed protein product [Candida verbasci]
MSSNFFKKLVKKSDTNNVKDINKNSSNKLSPKSTTKSSRSTTTSISRKSSIKSRSKGYVDDSESSLYNDDEGDTNTMMEFSDDNSSISSQSLLNRSKSNILNQQTFDNHKIEDKVLFPSIEETPFTEIPELNLQQNEDPPWVGLTYESFLTPKYVKISRRNKQSPRILNHLFLAQELNIESISGTGNTTTTSDSDGLSDDFDAFLDTNKEIFVMEFSKDGKYLAAAGRDSIIRIWKVISSPLGRLEYNQQEREEHLLKRSNKRDDVFDSAPVFHRRPVIEFRGHTRSILSLSWSKNNFLISGSMDKTVKLWHVDRDSCLKTFQNEDFVTSVKFHPLDDRFFLSGSLDNELRLWSILENSVAFGKNLGEDVLITAVEFTPDGLHCIVGGFNGSVFCLETKGLHTIHRVEVKEKSIVHPFHDKNGNKITGIKVFENPNLIPVEEASELDKWTVLITTNDSKIRTVSTSKKKLITRFRGLTNNSSSIVASSNDDNKYIISGSEDHYCYVWENNNNIINNRLKQTIKEFVIDGKQHINEFNHKHEKLTHIIHSNKLVRKLLNDDNEYDVVANENNSYSCFHAHHSRCNVALFAPGTTKKLLSLSDDIIYDLKRRGVACKMNPNSFCTAKEHKHIEDYTGEIIITTDQSGLIRVFRQDCAAGYRKKFIDFYKRGSSNDMLTPTETIKSKRYCERSVSPSRDSKNIKNLLTSKLGSSKVASQTSIPAQGTTSTTSNIFMQPDISLILEHDYSLNSLAQRNSSQQTLNVVPNEHARKVDTNNESFPPINNNVPKIVLPNYHSQIENLKFTN